MSRSVRAGETVRLRARFRDDLQQVTTAGSVFVHIFEPDEDTSDLANAIVVSGVPTYLGAGIYEYEYITPDCDGGGIWSDLWEGSLACQDVTAEFNFTVVDGGAFSSLENQLYDNDLVEVFIPSGIMALDGAALLEDFSFEFMVTTSPSYTNLRKIRLEVGAFLSEVGDDTIQTAILEASLEADVLIFVSRQINSKLFLHARREYVTCLASSFLLDNVNNNTLKSKTLSDLSVQYDTNGIRDASGKLRDCLAKWLPQIIAGGGARAGSQPSMVIKGAADPDRPSTGRLWESQENGLVTGQKYPAANYKARNINKRRYVKGYWPNSTKKPW